MKRIMVLAYGGACSSFFWEYFFTVLDLWGDSIIESGASASSGIGCTIERRSAVTI